MALDNRVPWLDVSCLLFSLAQFLENIIHDFSYSKSRQKLLMQKVRGAYMMMISARRFHILRDAKCSSSKLPI